MLPLDPPPLDPPPLDPPQLNPVERRLLDLRLQWDAFTADPAPRLLVWTAPDAALRLVQCFLEIQKHDNLPYVTGDLFIRFDAPFEHSIQYSRALKDSLAGQLEASRASLALQGLGPVHGLDPAAYPDSAWGFMCALRAVGGAYHRSIGHLAAVLAPPAVAGSGGFAGWLGRALEAGLPERLRLVVVDSAETPLLPGWRRPLAQRAAVAVDATAMATETFAQERVPGPAGTFRSMLMALAALVERGSAEQVQDRAADAAAFAARQGWNDQGAVVAMLVAGALLKEQRIGPALQAYAGARAKAARAQAEGNPAGGALVLQTWFGEAGALLAAGRVPEAADAYGQAAAVAQAAPNLVLAIEAFRMVAFCRAREPDRDAAVDAGGQALALGARLQPAARGMTTLPLAATDLLRVLDPARVAEAQAVAARWHACNAALAHAIEGHAALHERTGDNAVLHAAEAELAARTEATAQAAAREVAHVVAGGAAPFGQAHATAQALLGHGWLLRALPDLAPDAAP